VVEPCREAGGGYVCAGAVARATAGVRGVLLQGLQPCTCRGNSKSGIPWDGGALWVCGDAVNPQCPAFDSWPVAVGGCRPLVGTSVRYRMNHPRMAWMKSVRYRMNSFVPTNGRHPPKQDAVPTARGELSKAGWVRLRGCERHGCRDQAPMDGFTASPATGPTPPSHRKPAFDVDVDFSRCRAASPAKRPNYSGGVSRTRWMSVGVDSGIPRSASICSRLKYRSLRVPYTCLGLAT